MKKITLLLFSIFSAFISLAQIDKEFWFVVPYLPHYNNPQILYIGTTNNSATIEISMPANTTFPLQTVNLNANSVYTLDLTPWINTFQNTPPNTILNKGIYIKSNNNITTFFASNTYYGALNPEFFSLKVKKD
jgi:hypothetical protein